MRKIFGAFMIVALVAGAAAFIGLPPSATAQGGGTVEVEVKYNGAPVVEKLKVNKDTEKCGTETTVEKVVVGSNKGLANAVASVPAAKGGKAVKGVRVRIKGSTISGTTNPSNAQGVVKHSVKPMKAGIVTFAPVSSKSCKNARVGVIGVFTPPVTG